MRFAIHKCSQKPSRKIFLVKQNIVRVLGMQKRAIDLALEIGCEDDLNNLLQVWIKEKERERYDDLKNESNKENLPNISNPHQTRTKGAPKIPKKRVKSGLENTTAKHRNKEIKCLNKNVRQQDHL